MRNLLFIILSILASKMLAQTQSPPQLAPGLSFVSNSTWSAYRDVTQPIQSGIMTGPNGSGDLLWTTLSGAPSLLWVNAQHVNEPSCLTPFNQIPVPDSKPIWTPRSGCSSDPGLSNPQDDVIYTRRTFNITQLGCPTKIDIKADNNAYIYVNGHFIGYITNGMTSVTTFTVPPSYLTLGLNVVAIQVADDGITGWMSCKVYMIPCW